MKANIKLALKTLTPGTLGILVGNVAAKLNGNADLPAPPLSASELKDLSVRLLVAVTVATDGSRLSKSLRDNIVVEAQGALRRVADYVRMMAQGDQTILAGSGFELANQSAPPIPIEAPKAATTRMTGRHGEAELRWSGVRNRRSYIIYRCDQDPALPDAVWEFFAITGKVKHRVQGLTPYEPHWFCVSAVGALGESNMSAPILARAAQASRAVG